MASFVDFTFKIMQYLYRSNGNIAISPLAIEISILNILASLSEDCQEEIWHSVLEIESNENEQIEEYFRRMRSILDELRLLDEFRIYSFIYLSRDYEMIQNYCDVVGSNLDTIVKQVHFDNNSLALYQIIDNQVR